MPLNDEQLERYSRQIILKEAGLRGQERLLKSRALIIGAGGLGSPAALYLAAAGVGLIGIADADEVDLSNLQRQILHRGADLGKPKVRSARETLQALNSDVEVVPYHGKIDGTNIAGIIKDRDYGFIIDGTDNFPAKFLINDACVSLQKPFVHGGVIRFQGQLMTWLPGKGPCYRCVFGAPPPPDAVPSCRQAGVLGAVAGITGSLQAAEALKFFLELDGLLTGRLLTFNALTMNFRTVSLAPNPRCPVCGENAFR